MVSPAVSLISPAPIPDIPGRAYKRLVHKIQAECLILCHFIQMTPP